SMNSILRFQYFITKEMRADLGHGNVSGTLPILYVFLARLGYTVVDVTHVSSPAEGVKITFSGGEQPQTLYYFKTDLSGSNSAFLRWCAARGPGLSLLKAASFLMHGDGFSGVRNFLVQNSRVIIQDDSGIPLRAFPKGWKVNCYGPYIPHKDELKGRNNEKALSFRADAGNQIARRIAAETGITPILVLPSRNQHLLEIGFTSVGTGAIVPPAEGEGTIGRGSAPALLKGISRDYRRAIRQNKLTQFRPLSCRQNPTGSK